MFRDAIFPLAACESSGCVREYSLSGHPLPSVRATRASWGEEPQIALAAARSEGRATYTHTALECETQPRKPLAADKR
jgi:hypothetical protein